MRAALRRIPWAAMRWVAEVLEENAERHGDEGIEPGWLSRDPDYYAERALSHLADHFDGRQRGIDVPINTDDGPHPHLVHACANAMIAVALLAIESEDP